MRVLVTGISGFAGSALLPRLLEEGHEVRALARDHARVELALRSSSLRSGNPVSLDDFELTTGDTLSGAGVPGAMRGVEVAYYLIHSMEPSPGGGSEISFEARERASAETFAQAARAAGVRRIVYLGGPLPPARGASMPPTPDASMPSTPDASIPSNRDASMPSTPDASIPSNRDASIPSTPDASIPSNRGPSIPSTPDASIPSTPDASIPSNRGPSMPPAPDAPMRSSSADARSGSSAHARSGDPASRRREEGRSPISPHLASRNAVERILLEAVSDSVALRASIVIGARSRSFRFLVRLVERMPVLALPAWRRFRSRPIDERDIVEMLACCASVNAVAGRSFDVGGPEVLTYGEVVRRIAELMMLSRPSVGIGLTVTPIAARVAAAIAHERPELVLPLMESLTGDLLPTGEDAAELLGVELHSFDSAVEHALGEWEKVEELAAR